MNLSLKETMGGLNEKALTLAAQQLVAHHAEADIIAAVRQALAMPTFRGNLLAVRLTDEQKVRQAEVGPELVAARAVLLRALREEIAALEPHYKERLANSHK
jgi:hypothetical protein